MKDLQKIITTLLLWLFLPILAISQEEIYLKAIIQIQTGRTDSAIRILEQALDNTPDDPTLQRLLAGQYFEAGDHLKAARGFAVLVQLDSTDVASWLKLAEIASSRQQNEKALQILEKILDLDSANLKGLMMMGEILGKMENPGAIAYYERALELYPDNQNVAYTLGNLYIKSQLPDKVIPLCERILSSDSTHIRFRKLMGYAYYKMGDPYPAVTHLKQAALYGDSSVFTFKFMGISQYLAADFQGAIESLDMAVALDSLDAEVHFFLGASLATTTQKKRAMVHLDRSLVLMQPDAAVIARIYSEQGNIMRLEAEYEKAYGLYSQAWEADTTNPMALYYKASIMDNSLHRSEKALEDYQYFLERLEENPATGQMDNQVVTIRRIVEDRIEALREELFFLDR
jgi:tetratricopeptide (TPR) repeat protein